jgi:hypothetical protein
VQKQQGKQISIIQLIFWWVKITHHRLRLHQHHDGLRATSNVHRPPPSFTTPNPPGVFNTSMVRGRSDMGMRYGVYQHVLLDVFDSAAKCLNLAMFCGTNCNTTHSNTQPAQHLWRSNTHPPEAMRQQQGEKDMGTSWFFILVSKLTWFSYTLLQDWP